MPTNTPRSLFIAAVLAGIFELPVLLYAHTYVLRFVNMCISAIDYKYFIVGGAVFGGFTVLYYAACVTASGIINLKPKDFLARKHKSLVL